MSNLVQRLLLFFIGLPLLVAAVVFLPHYRHGLVVLLVLVFAGGSGAELSRLFRARNVAVTEAAGAFLACLPPLIVYVFLLFAPRGASVLAGVGLGVLILIALGQRAFVRAEEIEGSLFIAAAYGFTILYIGGLSSFLVMIVADPDRGTETILSFFMMTFANDSLAWLTGSLFGRRRGIVAVSPNKSAVGFAGGLLGSLAAGCAAKLLFPASFLAPLWACALGGLAVGVAVILGDLFESGLKRSAGIKDSGTSIPGRGGFLDSFDSLLFAAPAFFAVGLFLGLFKL